MKKKLQTRFPATRIKKIMQTDEDVGKIAMAVPLLVSKALELFLQDLCNHTYDVTLSRGAKTVNSVHLKQCVNAFNIFDFLRDTVGKVPDLGGSEGEDRPATKRRKLVDESISNDEDIKTTDMVTREAKYTSGGRGRRGRGRGGYGGRTENGQSLKFEDDLEDASPEGSESPSPENWSLSHEVASWNKVASHKNNQRSSELKVRDFDLNVEPDENGEFATSPERELEGRRSWPLFGINEMKIDSDQREVVILAGGFSSNLQPLVSKEIPKALLPVANRPVLSYVLDLLESSNLKDLIVVVEGEDAALKVGGWISSACVDRLHVEVAAVAENVGTAGALRAIAHHLTAKDILIVSGDIVSDVSPGAVAATHRRHDASVTAMLCAEPVSGPSESGVAGGKDKTKKPACYDIIGLDSSKQFLLHIATGAEIKKDTRIQKSILCAAGEMEIRSDLMDSHIYAFKRSVLQKVLDQKPTFRSLKQDVLPYLVRTQLRSEVFPDEKAVEDNGKHNVQNNEVVLSQILSNASLPSFHQVYESGLNSRKTHKCCVYIADESKYCVRLNSIQAFMDVNRDVIGDANHLSGYSFSAHHNIVHPSAELGSKTTVGPHCMLGEGSQVGDKCSVKRSVIGRHCRIGSNVKVVNSVVMDHATIGDGCSIQGSVICSNAQLQERVSLRDCQVEAGYVVYAGGEHKGETFARK
ncbi:hypothetical protein Bca4012_026314 [Brassica carinata]